MVTEWLMLCGIGLLLWATQKFYQQKSWRCLMLGCSYEYTGRISLTKGLYRCRHCQMLHIKDIKEIE